MCVKRSVSGCMVYLAQAELETLIESPKHPLMSPPSPIRPAFDIDHPLSDSSQRTPSGASWQSATAQRHSPPRHDLTHLVALPVRRQVLLPHLHLLHLVLVSRALEHALEVQRLRVSARATIAPSRSLTSCFSTRVHAVPSLPARAVRPTRWTYLRMSRGMSYDTTCSTDGRSMPRAMRSEQTSLAK